MAISSMAITGKNLGTLLRSARDAEREMGNDEHDLLSENALFEAQVQQQNQQGANFFAAIQREMDTMRRSEASLRKAREELALSVEKEDESLYGPAGRPVEMTADLPALSSELALAYSASKKFPETH